MKILETQRDPCHQTCPSKYLSIFQCQPAFSWKIIAHNYTAYSQLYSSGHLDILTILLLTWGLRTSYVHIPVPGVTSAVYQSVK